MNALNGQSVSRRFYWWFLFALFMSGTLATLLLWGLPVFAGWAQGYLLGVLLLVGDHARGH